MLFGRRDGDLQLKVPFSSLTQHRGSSGGLFSNRFARRKEEWWPVGAFNETIKRFIVFLLGIASPSQVITTGLVKSSAASSATEKNVKIFNAEQGKLEVAVSFPVKWVQLLIIWTISNLNQIRHVSKEIGVWFRILFEIFLCNSSDLTSLGLRHQRSTQRPRGSGASAALLSEGDSAKTIQCSAADSA